MRLRVASYHRLLLLLINLITQGLSADQKKNDIRKTSSSPNSLMDTMMKKYSYPKNEVTAGIGYGHHLHPLYYRGQKEIMYPCAVECGEWETMSMDDNANDASSNVDVVTVHPDVSNIDITTSKSRSYKDISSLRGKKYQPTTAATPKNGIQDFVHQDSKGADVKIIPQKSDKRYLGESSANDDLQMPNDGSLYAKYYDALVSGYGGERGGELAADSTGNKENEEYNFDPVEESMKYNSPSFNDAESDDIEAPVYPTKTKISRPNNRERIEEKYVKHNVREERLEDVRTNSFGPYNQEDDDYSTDNSDLGNKQSGGYNPSKYIDDYAAPITLDDHKDENYSGGDRYKEKFAGSGDGTGKPFRPSPPQGEAFYEGENRSPAHFRGQGEKFHPFYGPRGKIPQQGSNGYSDYQAEDYGVKEEGIADYYDEPKYGAHLGGPGNYNGKPARIYGKKYPQGRLLPQDPRIIRRPPGYGKNRKYPGIINGITGGSQRRPYAARLHQFPSKPYHGSYPRISYPERGTGYPYHPYAPRHGYSPQNQEFPARSSPGGLRIVSPPRIRGADALRHGKYPDYYAKGDRNYSPYARGQRVSYRQTIPQKNGFIKIVKKYRSFVDHTAPKRYVIASG